MTECKNHHRILFFFEAVQRDMACLATGNNQFAQCLLDRATNQRMTPQQSHHFFDQFYGISRSRRLAVDQEHRQPLKVGQRLYRIDQPRHDFGFGLFAFFPVTRALR